jgi:hypothetical protein
MPVDPVLASADEGFVSFVCELPAARNDRISSRGSKTAITATRTVGAATPPTTTAGSATPAQRCGWPSGSRRPTSRTDDPSPTIRIPPAGCRSRPPPIPEPGATIIRRTDVAGNRSEPGRSPSTLLTSTASREHSLTETARPARLRGRPPQPSARRELLTRRQWRRGPRSVLGVPRSHRKDSAMAGDRASPDDPSPARSSQF